MKKFLFVGIAAAVMFSGIACGRKDADTVSDAAGKDTEQESLAVQEEMTVGEASDAAAEPAAQTPVFIVVENPGRGYYFSGETSAEQAQTVKLELVLQKPNAIIDTEEWFSENDIEKPFYDIPPAESEEIPENLPEGIPFRDENGLPIVGINFDEDWIYVVYGEGYWEGCELKIFDRKNLQLTAEVDFSAYRYVDDTSSMQQRLWWARLRDGVLYASFGHGTYAENAPFHAYIAAVELDSGRVIWKTEPLVSNAYNFEIAGDILIAGYGFTKEDDYLYQLDIFTGKILEQIPLKSKPDYIIRKDDVLYVRTYDTNYLFQMED